MNEYDGNNYYSGYADGYNAGGYNADYAPPENPVGMLPDDHWSHSAEWVKFADDLVQSLQADPQLVEAFNVLVEGWGEPEQPKQGKFSARHGVLSDPKLVTDVTEAIRRFNSEKKER
jgi:hypothetical protein